MSMSHQNKYTYDLVCFTDLAYEFDFSDKKEAEKKIKRRLKYYKLGDYSQERVEYIRELKNDLYQEIGLQTKSKYFSKSKSNFADLADFKLEKMILHKTAYAAHGFVRSFFRKAYILDIYQTER